MIQKKKELIQKLFKDESKPLGLILNERMINVPPEIALPMHKALFEEIQLAKEEDKEDQARWNFENYLMITSSYTEGAKIKKKKKQKRTQVNNEVIYFKAEDEVYAKESFLLHSFPLESQQNAKTLNGSVSQQRFILAFSASKIKSIMKQLEILLPLPSNS